jgi:branched-chain amino acid transport system substrate-binding protein
VHSLGLSAAKNVYLTTGFYWNMNDATRAWSKRFFERTGVMPTMAQAGVYSSILHYLRAVKAAKTLEAGPVVSKIKATPVNDMFATGGKVREDGRMVHDMYLVRVKELAQSKAPWDYYEVVRTIKGDDAFRPMSAGNCPLVAK